MIRRTREERDALVSQWRASGKKMVDWCREQQIPITTFCGWAYAKKAPKGHAVAARSDFTELTGAGSLTRVRIEWRGCTIDADPHTARLILEKCLPIMGRYSC